MDPRKLDLQILYVFKEIYNTRSVSKTATNTGLSQPTVSFNLKKLRQHFNDPLFVRTPSGMKPTPHAESLAPSIMKALELLNFTLGHEVVFDAKESSRTFRVCMTDTGQYILLPELAEKLMVLAPDVKLKVVTQTTADTPKMLEEGELDLAVGYMPNLEAGFYQQKLFVEVFACLVRQGHPRIRDSLSLQQFQQESHIEVNDSGTGHAGINKLVSANGISINTPICVPNYFGLDFIVANTDLVATVPRRIAEKMASRSAINILVPPLKLSPYQVKQHWHERYHNDPGNKWLRGVIAELFLR